MKLPEQIDAQRVVLVGLTKPTFELAEALYAVVDKTRDTIREWLSWVDRTHCAEDEYTHYLVEWCLAHWKEEKGFAYLVCLKETNKILGCVDIFNVSEQDQSGEIGYWLSKDAQGHGYMQEAVRALESESFKAGFNRIIIRNDTQNLRSAHVAERCGYTLEGVMRQDAWDEYHKKLRDTNLWAKLKSEWKAETK